MKRSLLIALISITIPCFAQRNCNDFTHRISSIVSDDQLEMKEYSYNSNDQIVSVHENNQVSFWEYIDSLYYDSDDNIIRINTYQFIKDNWLWVNYIEYTYNEMGQRITRKNYNDFGWGFELGGTFYYSYDENGNQIHWELEFGTGIYQICDRTFNENNQIVQEIGKSDNFTGTFENSWKIDFSYDEQHFLSEKQSYYWQGSWILEKTETFEYDESGNCVLAQAYKNNAIVEKKIYNYDMTVLADNVIYYENPEMNWPVLPTMNNMITQMDYYTVDENNVLQHYCDYIFSYDEITSVNESFADFGIYPNPAKDNLTVESDEADFMEIYNVLGSKVFSSDMKGGNIRVNLSDFSEGVYFVRLYKGDSFLVKKVLVNK